MATVRGENARVAASPTPGRAMHAHRCPPPTRTFQQQSHLVVAGVLHTDHMVPTGALRQPMLEGRQLEVLRAHPEGEGLDALPVGWLGRHQQLLHTLLDIALVRGFDGPLLHTHTPETRRQAKRDSEAFPLQRAKLTLPGVALYTHPGVQWECLVLFDGGAHERQCRTVLKQRKRLVWGPDACIRRASHCWRNRSNNRLGLRHRSRRKNGSVRRAAAEQQAPPMPAPHWSHPQCLIRV